MSASKRFRLRPRPEVHRPRRLPKVGALPRRLPKVGALPSLRPNNPGSRPMKSHAGRGLSSFRPDQRVLSHIRSTSGDAPTK